MKKYLKMLFRLYLEVVLTVVMMPIIISSLLISLISYMIVFKLNNEKILNGMKTWSNLIKKGIMMNVDFIVNGL